MSILGDGYRYGGSSSGSSRRVEREKVKENQEDDLLVFGYSCKLYRDDKKALLEDSGALLLPWMGDETLMVDRYDIRNRLEDKSQFGLKSNLPVRLTREEEEFEQQLEEERYLFLGKDVLEEELLEEEEKKRLLMSLAPDDTYHAVGFSYDQKTQEVEEKVENSEPHVLVDQPQLIQHPPTSSVDIVEHARDCYQVPQGLFVPRSVPTPCTIKLHQIIQKTARFISQQGPQMEIIIKTKQQYNPHFSFLDFSDRLFPYYKHLLNAISSGEYVPVDEEVEQEMSKNDEENRTKEEEKKEEGEEDDEDEEDETYDLHPLLRGGSSNSNNKATNRNTSSSSSSSSSSSVSMFTISTPLLTARTKSAGGAVNSAPPILNTSVSLPDYMYTHPSYAGYNSTSYLSSSASWSLSTSSMATVDSISGTAGSTQTSYTGYYGGYHSQAAPVPPPPDLQPIIDKTAAYVAKNGPGFERTVLEKHVGDPRFDFLSPWNNYHGYYQAKVQENQHWMMHGVHEIEGNTTEPVAAVRPVKETTVPTNPNLQRLNDGAVKFTLAPKPVRTTPMGVTLEEDDEEEEPPEAKRPRTENVGNGRERMDGKLIKEFLHTVKSMLT